MRWLFLPPLILPYRTSSTTIQVVRGGWRGAKSSAVRSRGVCTSLRGRSRAMCVFPLHQSRRWHCRPTELLCPWERVRASYPCCRPIHHPPITNPSPTHHPSITHPSPPWRASQASTLQRLMFIQPHELFITTLLMSPAESACGLAAITCAGDDSCTVTTLTLPTPPTLLTLLTLLALLTLLTLLTLLAVSTPRAVTMLATYLLYSLHLLH